MTVLAPILQSMESAIDAAGAGVVGATDGVLGKVFTLLLATSICLWAVKILQGKEEANPTSLAVQYIRYALIGYVFASVYNPILGFTIAGFITDLPAAIGAMVGVSVNAPAQIDGLLARSIEGVIQILDAPSGGITAIKETLIALIIGFVVLVVSIVVCGIAITMFFVAKLSLKVCILFAAFAIMMLLVEKTKPWFSTWLNFTVMVAILFVINSFMLNVVFVMLNGVFDMLFTLSGGATDGELPVSLSGLAGYVIAFLAAAFGLLKAEQMAFTIGGAAGASSAGFMTLVMGGANTATNAVTNVAQGGLNAGRGAVDAVRGFSGGGAGDGAGQKMLSNPNNTSLAYGVGNLGVRGAMAAGRAMKRVAGSAGAAASSAFGDGNSASGSGGNTVRPSSGRFDSNK